MLKNITYLSIFPAVGLCCCTRAFSSGASEGCAPLVCPGSRCIGSSRRSTGSRAHSVAVPHAIRAPRACGLLPSQGSGQCPLHWQTDSQPLGHQGDRTAHDRGCPCRMRLQKGPVHAECGFRKDLSMPNAASERTCFKSLIFGCAVRHAAS